MKKTLFFFAGCVFVFLPFTAFAVADPASLLGGSSDGLVPFRGLEGYFYRACDLISLANNVINFGVAFSVIVATLMFAYAGILYVTAAGAGAEQVKKAHKVFVNVFVGLLFVLLAWLIVNILFSVLSGKGLDVWSKVACVDNPTTGSFDPAADRGIDPISVAPLGSNSGAYPPATGARCSPIRSGPCSAENLSPSFGQTNAANMSTICHVESGGVPTAGGDIGWYTNKPFSYGLFQINLTAHQVSCPDGRVLNCPAAFGAPANPNETRTMVVGGKTITIRALAGWGRPIVNMALYNQCAAAATDPACNIYTASQKFKQAGYAPWKPDVTYCGLST